MSGQTISAAVIYGLVQLQQHAVSTCPIRKIDDRVSEVTLR